MVRFLIVSGSIIVLLLVLIWSMGSWNPSQSWTNFVPHATAPTTSKPVNNLTDKIQVSVPASGQHITSPLTVTGKARGYWYFEASFPVELRDSTKKVLASTTAQAQSEWTTTEFVPFSAVLNFSKPRTRTGTLVLKRDNPSGLPQNNEELEIPVKF